MNNNGEQTQLNEYNNLDIQKNIYRNRRSFFILTGLFSLVPSLANSAIGILHNNFNAETVASSPTTYISIASYTLCAIVRKTYTIKIKDIQNKLNILAKELGTHENNLRK